jgi:hypothetical protein
MDDLGRLILRFLVVPFGALVAVCVGVIVIIVGEWNAFVAALEASPNVPPDTVAAMFFMAPWVLMVLIWSAMLMLAPGAIGILIAEFFAIRSWIFHIGNGIASAWVGATLIDRPDANGPFFSNPKLVILAGLLAGLAYWLIAGWNAGFFKPVMQRDIPKDAPH